MPRLGEFSRVYVRKMVSSYPALILAILAFLTLWQTTNIRRSDERFGYLNLTSGVNVMAADLSVLVDTKTNIINADFKRAQNNPDGSIDVIFRVYRTPRSSEAKSTAVKLPQIHMNSSKSPAQIPPNGTVPRTAYPLTLGSDFLINTLTLCPLNTPVDYLIIVHSATAYFQRRRDIRETYGGRGVFGDVSQRVVFMLGTTTDPVATRMIQHEALRHGDLVQGRFRDSYHNLTHKAVMGFRWAASHCSQAKLILKIDDDVFVNTFKLVSDVLPVYTTSKRRIACHLRKAGTSPIVRGKGRWRVSDDEFKGYSRYPFDHCNGYFVIITADLLEPLVRAAWLNPFFWIDDVYVFGVLPATVGSVTFVNIRSNLTLHFPKGKTCVEKEGFNCNLLAISQYREGGMEALWYSLLSNMSDPLTTRFKLFQNS
ncbi:hypothetical protein EGW08_005415 [Elysia chlorotica]|uniref:Hexosyltransferase n=1 Tax=Elysia chlorotica TaxID=188477 RepID=A0A433TZ07_ELYCH|nr:hypothetical protein EGW08_005415 [Elysia chlorotica]